MSIKYPLIVFIYLLLSHNGFSQRFYGLRFKSFDFAQEKRTSLIVGKNWEIEGGKDSTEISFDLKFHKEESTYFGYVLRLVTKKGEKISLICEPDSTLKLIINNQVSAPILLNKKSIFENWSQLSLNIKKTNISFYVDNKICYSIKYELKDKHFQLLFGAGDDGSFFTTDVPGIILSRLKISKNKDIAYSWALEEGDGSDKVMSEKGNVNAYIVNPIWEKEQFTSWATIATYKIKGNASICYDQEKGNFHIIGEDSLWTLNASNDTLTKSARSSKNYHPFFGNRSFYNPLSQEIVNYYIDDNYISDYSFKNDSWSKNFDTVKLTQYSQANEIFSPKYNSLYFIGGYGLLTYKNSIQKYDFNNGTWTHLNLSGDYFTPRYLAAAGITGDSIYVFGGYGSQSGNQIENPHYLYDLSIINIKTNSIKHIYTFPSFPKNLVFSSNMIIDSAKKTFYALAFSKDTFDAHFKLLKGSLEKPSYKFLANEIPFPFQDIFSSINLFINKSKNKLYAVTSYINRDKYTIISINQISFPPGELGETNEPSSNNFSWKFVYIASIFLLLFISITYIIFKRKKKRKQITIVTENEYIETIDTDKEIDFSKDLQIFLLGDMEIINQNEHSLKAHFTPLLKELFFLFLLNRIFYNKGLSAERINSIFWKGRDDREANKNRSVNIAKLKSVLEPFQYLAIQKNANKWNMEFSEDNAFIDVYAVLSFLQNSHSLEREIVIQNVRYLKRGVFLKNIEYEWLDEIKATFSNLIIDNLLPFCEKLDIQKDMELVIDICDIVFFYDPLNEQTLSLKCQTLAANGRHTLAKYEHSRFTKLYSEIYGTSFNVPFKDVASADR